MSVANSSPSEDSSHPDDHSQSGYISPGFKASFYKRDFINLKFIYMHTCVASLNMMEGSK